MYSKLLLIIVTFFFATVSHGTFVGGEIQTFAPSHYSPYFFTLHGGEVLKKGQKHFGLMVNYLDNDVDIFPNYTSTNATGINRKYIGGDLWFGFGVTENSDFGIYLPIAFSNKTTDAKPQLEKTAINEIRAIYRHRVIDSSLVKLMMSLAINFDTINTNFLVGDDVPPSFTPQLDAQFHLTKNLVLGANLGYRIRFGGGDAYPTIQYPVPPYTSDVMTGSLGLSLVLDELKIIGELDGARAIDKSDPYKVYEKNDMLEGRLGIKYAVNKKWDVFGGMGMGIWAKGLTPEQRFFGGVMLTVGEPVKPKVETEVKIVEKTVVLAPGETAEREVQSTKLKRVQEDYINLDDLNFDIGEAEEIVLVQPIVEEEVSLVEQTVAPELNVELPVMSQSNKEPVMVEEAKVVITEPIIAQENKIIIPEPEIREVILEKPEPKVVKSYKKPVRIKEPVVNLFQPVDKNTLDYDSSEFVDLDRAGEIGNYDPKNVYFDTAMSHLTKRERIKVDRLGRYIKENNPSYRMLLINGHTDNVGSMRINKQLSSGRASNTMKYLNQKWGVPMDKMHSRAYSDKSPATTNTTNKGKSLNRRVTFKILM